VKLQKKYQQEKDIDNVKVFNNVIIFGFLYNFKTF